MEQITVSDVVVNIVRKKIKNIHLAVYPPNGRVRLAAPLGVDNDTIRLFVVSKLAWIKRNQKGFAQQERTAPREYKERESHYYQGARYLLNIIEKDAPAKVVLRNKTYIELYARPGASAAKCHETLATWYRAQLRLIAAPLIEKWTAAIGVQVTDWRVKQMKTKWGSCNAEAKRIWLNLELVKKPSHCLEYVIVHELVHTMERRHNDRFVALMDKYLPNWKKHKAELNKLPVGHEEWGGNH